MPTRSSSTPRASRPCAPTVTTCTSTWSHKAASRPIARSSISSIRSSARQKRGPRIARRGGPPSRWEASTSGSGPSGKWPTTTFAKSISANPRPHQLNLEQFRKMANGRSIRQTMASFNAVDLSIELCGTPDAVAARMGEVMEEVGGDGFLFSMPNVNRRTLAEIEDGLVPALQDRGLMRTVYEHKHFRDNLLAY